MNQAYQNGIAAGKAREDAGDTYAARYWRLQVHGQRWSAAVTHVRHAGMVSLMPTMPKWATGGRIVWDDEHGLAFIRHGLRRSPWQTYVRTADGYVEMDASITTGNNLERLHKYAIEAVGESIGKMVVSLHPGAAYLHLVVRDPKRTYITYQHACGIPYQTYKSAPSATDVTCPTCLAILAEDLAAKAGQIGFEKFEQKREEVRTVRAFNAFGRVVTGEQATEHDI